MAKFNVRSIFNLFGNNKKIKEEAREKEELINTIITNTVTGWYSGGDTHNEEHSVLSSYELSVLKKLNINDYRMSLKNLKSLLDTINILGYRSESLLSLIKINNDIVEKYINHSNAREIFAYLEKIVDRGFDFLLQKYDIIELMDLNILDNLTKYNISKEEDCVIIFGNILKTFKNNEKLDYKVERYKNIYNLLLSKKEDAFLNINIEDIDLLEIIDKSYTKLGNDNKKKYILFKNKELITKCLEKYEINIDQYLDSILNDKISESKIYNYNYDNMSDKEMLDYIFTFAASGPLNPLSVEEYKKKEKENLLKGNNPLNSIVIPWFNYEYTYSLFCDFYELFSKYNIDDLKRYNLTEDEIYFLQIFSLYSQMNCRVLSLEDYQNIINNDIDRIIELKYKIDSIKMYKIIKRLYEDEIINSLSNTSSLLSNKILEKDNVSVYELDGQNFSFLIHHMGLGANGGMKGIFDKEKKNPCENPELWDSVSQDEGNNAICCSLISNSSFHFIPNHDGVFYGFNNLSDIIGISKGDAGTSFSNGIKNIGAQNSKYYSSSKLLNTYCSHNEVSFKRYKNKISKKPDFIICFRNVNSLSIKHAKYHNIPIVVINPCKYLINLLQNIKNEILNIRKNINCQENLDKLSNHIISYRNLIISSGYTINKVLLNMLSIDFNESMIDMIQEMNNSDIEEIIKL